MRVFKQENENDRGIDAMASNPGNLYFYYSPNEPLPLTCPFRTSLWYGADYVVCGPDGWYLAKDLGTSIIRLTPKTKAATF